MFKCTLFISYSIVFIYKCFNNHHDRPHEFQVYDNKSHHRSSRKGIEIIHFTRSLLFQLIWIVSADVALKA